jgi:hypothetical protein
VRRAATLLLDVTERPRYARSTARRCLARTQLLRLPQQQVITANAPFGELHSAVENCRIALTELGSGGDPVDRALVTLQLARFLRRSNRTAVAIDTLEQNPLQHDQSAPTPAILEDAPFLGAHIADKLRFKHAEVLYNGYKDLQNLDVAMRWVETARTAARSYTDAIPTDFAHTFVLEGHIHRRKRDVPAMFRVEKESKALVAEYPNSPAVARLASVQASANATKLHDLTRAQSIRFERLQTRLFNDLKVDIVGKPSITRLMTCVEQYRRLNSKAGITWLGNAAFDISSGYVRAGDTEADPDVRAYAAGLLDVAEAAWDGFATNGVSSVLYGRARLALRSGDDPTDELTDDLLTANRNAYRSGTAQNALNAAVRYGVAGNRNVRARLDELLRDVDPRTSYIAYAKLQGLSVEWLWRSALSVNPPDVDWSMIEVNALTAARALRSAGVSIVPESEAVAWMAAARALAEQSAADRPEVLHRSLQAIRCVTELMLTIATTVDRRRMAAKFHALFAQSARLAIELGDHAAADMIMEAARRDRVGLLLAELARNPEVGTGIRAAALAMQDSSSITVDSVAVETDDDTEDDDEDGVRGRSALIAVDRASAIKAAESVLGPLSALADTGFLEMATARTVLERRPADQQTTTAVLQLLPLPSDDKHGDSSITVFRRCTLAVAGLPVRDVTDTVRVPRLFLDLEAGEDRVFEWRANYTPMLLPQALTELLESAPENEPIRLMIVPTGFFHIPFDALPVSTDTHVLDHALVSIHGSLTSALSLMALEERRADTPSLAVYDHSLVHARDELKALLEALTGVRPIDSFQDLDSELTTAHAQSHSLLAMAVHGTGDDHGWGQAKKLRDADGNTVWITAARALSWTVPRLCVLASCNTPITAPDGVEVGGFPLALMLRGATTVIGGLYNIDDKATSQIMIAFWKHLAAGASALYALRRAKLDYLQDNSDARHTWPELWAGLTVYGASTS